MAMKMIAIHCSATPPNRDIGAAEIDVMHKQRGFERIGYNYVIRRDGRLEIGRVEGETLAHAQGYNKDAIAICLVGGVNEHNAPKANFTDAQMRTLRTAVDFLRIKYPQADLIGHRDLPGVLKDCPCFNVKHWCATGQFIEERKPV